MKINSQRSTILKFAVVVLALSVGYFGIGNPFFQGQNTEASASGPTESHTNAPGEANCTSCHSSFPLNSGTGTVALTGVPTVWRPGQQYSITITTSQEDAVIFGYQMTVIDSLGRRAGTLVAPVTSPTQSQVIAGTVVGNMRQYAEHTIDGILPTMFGSKSWNINWTAPAQPLGKVSFYVAGNAYSRNDILFR